MTSEEDRKAYNRAKTAKYRLKPGVKQLERERHAKWFKEKSKDHEFRRARSQKEGARYWKNKELATGDGRDWFPARNRDKINSARRDRYKNDFQYNLETRLKSVIRSAFIRGGTSKNGISTDMLIGCTIECLKIHLESLFLDGMSWDNYGRFSPIGPRVWNIDHIKPVSAFDLTDPQQVIECFHYTNCQPMWARENFSKTSIHNGLRIYRKKVSANGLTDASV